MNEIDELNLWQTAWREEKPAVRPDLRKLVDRQTWWIRLHTAIGILISLAFLGASLWQAVVQPTPEFIVLAIAIWIITLTTLIYSLWNRAGTWRPATQDTREFLQLSLRRYRANLRATTFGLYLLLVQVLLLVSWHTWYWSRHAPVPALQHWLLAACLPVAFLIALLVRRARKRQELKRLESLARELFE